MSKMHREDAGALPEQHGMMHGHKRMLMRQQEDIAEPASDFDYNALSPEIKRAVEQGFTGQNFVMEEINPVLGELVVTVGVLSAMPAAKSELWCCCIRRYRHA